MRKINKKASEKILSIWWFASLAFIGAAVVVVVMVYFGAFVDVRDKETMMLQEKIMDCVVKNGYLQQEVLKYSNEEFMDFCKLNKNQFGLRGEFLFNVTFYNSEEKIEKNLYGGAIGKYQKDCLATAGIKGNNLPYCIQARENVVVFNSEKFEKEIWTIALLVASNNQGYKQSIAKSGNENK